MSHRRRAKLTSRNADPHDLYQKSVQDPDHEAQFFVRLYKKKHGVRPHVMREDFCGTALLCAKWVSAHRENRAIGVDLDKPTLDWGREHNLASLGEAAERVTLLNRNVLEVTRPKADVICALNFSYFVFQTRDLMRRYFQTARKSLSPGGIFVIDLFGGPTAQQEEEEKRHYTGFTYIWRQAHFDPVTHHCIYHIDFRFPGGSRLRPAFTYDWRLWTIPELRELLEEAGFASSDVYWEGTDSETQEGSGVFRQVTKGDADDGWVSYLIAHPK